MKAAYTFDFADILQNHPRPSDFKGFPVTVTATSVSEAKSKALDLLGDPGRGRVWQGKLASVTELPDF